MIARFWIWDQFDLRAESTGFFCYEQADAIHCILIM
jgi:hypothetical protein